MSKVKGWLLAMILFTLMSFGCACIETDHITIDFARRPPKSSWQNIEVYSVYALPKTEEGINKWMQEKQFKPIGMVMAVAKAGDPLYNAFNNPKQDDYIIALQKEAAGMGADAIAGVMFMSSTDYVSQAGIYANQYGLSGYSYSGPKTTSGWGAVAVVYTGKRVKERRR